MSETEIKLFQLMEEYWSHFKIISATLNMLQNIHELQWSSEIILGKFPRAEIISLQMDVDEGWNNFTYPGIMHTLTILTNTTISWPLPG